MPWPDGSLGTEPLINPLSILPSPGPPGLSASFLRPPGPEEGPGGGPFLLPETSQAPQPRSAQGWARGGQEAHGRPRGGQRGGPGEARGKARSKIPRREPHSMLEGPPRPPGIPGPSLGLSGLPSIKHACLETWPFEIFHGSFSSHEEYLQALNNAFLQQQRLHRSHPGSPFLQHKQCGGTEKGALIP